MATAQIICDDVISGLRGIPDNSVNMAVTSPPYWGLRNYSLPPRQWSDGTVSVLGEEQTLDLYVQHLVEIFGEMRRVLHPTATFWLNIGDCYLHGGTQPTTGLHGVCRVPLPTKYKRITKVSKKQLGMVPARVSIALQDDGWILRQDIIWAKGVSFCPTHVGAIMPESVRDRACWSYEHVYQLALNDRYFYDIDGCREPYADVTRIEVEKAYTGQGQKDYTTAGAQDPSEVKRRVLKSIASGSGRNLRNVWVIPKQNYKGAHFSTFPEALVEPIIKLGTSEKGCCPHCFAPWMRNTIREPVPRHIQEQFEVARKSTVADTGRTDGHTHRKPNYRRKILGTEWEPGCSCDVGATRTVPAVVLDPFCGSGRAGIVAAKLGRNFIGIDQNERYCNLAREACENIHSG